MLAACLGLVGLALAVAAAATARAGWRCAGTHRPMQVDLGGLLLLNPGSAYGVTARDSATCATLDLATRAFRAFELRTGAERRVPRTAR